MKAQVNAPAGEQAPRSRLPWLSHCSLPRHNAVDENLKAVDQMVTELKVDRKVGLAYMKSWEKENYLIKKGERIGEERGIAIGEERGIAMVERGIQFMITDYLSEGKSEAEIIDKLQKGYGLTPEKAKEHFDIINLRSFAYGNQL